MVSFPIRHPCQEVASLLHGVQTSGQEWNWLPLGCRTGATAAPPQRAPDGLGSWSLVVSLSEDGKAIHQVLEEKATLSMENQSKQLGRHLLL